MFALLIAGLAYAGAGPWVARSEHPSLYVGAETQRIEQFVTEGGSLDDEAIVEVDEGLSIVYVKAIATLPLTPRADAELIVPWGHVGANRTDGGLCAALGSSACKTTQGFAPVSLRARVLLLDELLGAPVSLSLGAEARWGQHTADERERLTNLGEGTFDLGPTLGVGRSGALGGGYYYTYLDAMYRHRFPMIDASEEDADPTATEQLYGDQTLPGPEVLGELTAVIVPGGRFGFGPSVNYFSRVRGVDFSETVLTDVDRFTALRLKNLQAGLKVQLGMAGRATISASAYRSVYTENNPLITSFGVGFSFNELGRDEEG